MHDIPTFLYGRNRAALFRSHSHREDMAGSFPAISTCNQFITTDANASQAVAWYYGL